MDAPHKVEVPVLKVMWYRSHITQPMSCVMLCVSTFKFSFNSFTKLCVCIFICTNYKLAQFLVRSLFLVVREFVGWHQTSIRGFGVCYANNSKGGRNPRNLAWTLVRTLWCMWRQKRDAMPWAYKLLSNIPSSLCFIPDVHEETQTWLQLPSSLGSKLTRALWTLVLRYYQGCWLK